MSKQIFPSSINISGARGSGKTALAVRLLHTPEFQELPLWLVTTNPDDTLCYPRNAQVITSANHRSEIQCNAILVFESSVSHNAPTLLSAILGDNVFWRGIVLRIRDTTDALFDLSDDDASVSTRDRVLHVRWGYKWLRAIWNTEMIAAPMLTPRKCDVDQWRSWVYAARVPRNPMLRAYADVIQAAVVRVDASKHGVNVPATLHDVCELDLDDSGTLAAFVASWNTRTGADALDRLCRYAHFQAMVAFVANTALTE